MAHPTLSWQKATIQSARNQFGLWSMSEYWEGYFQGKRDIREGNKFTRHCNATMWSYCQGYIDGWKDHRKVRREL